MDNEKGIRTNRRREDGEKDRNKKRTTKKYYNLFNSTLKDFLLFYYIHILLTFFMHLYASTLYLQTTGLIKKIACTAIHLTKFGYVNMSGVIQNVVKTLNWFYDPLVMVSH